MSEQNAYAAALAGGIAAATAWLTLLLGCFAGLIAVLRVPFCTDKRDNGRVSHSSPNALPRFPLLLNSAMLSLLSSLRL